MTLPKNWQATIVETRLKVEDFWGTPTLVATARFIHEEAAELQSVLNRIENPELLRSVPLTEKDMPARELGQLLCMTGTLGSSTGLQIKPGSDDFPKDVDMTVDWLNIKTATLAYGVVARVKIGLSIDHFIIDLLEYITGMIVFIGDALGIDPYESMIDFLREVEAKVEKKRAEAQAT